MELRQQQQQQQQQQQAAAGWVGVAGASMWSVCECGRRMGGVCLALVVVRGRACNGRVAREGIVSIEAAHGPSVTIASITGGD